MGLHFAKFLFAIRAGIEQAQVSYWHIISNQVFPLVEYFQIPDLKERAYLH